MDARGSTESVTRATDRPNPSRIRTINDVGGDAADRIAGHVLRNGADETLAAGLVGTGRRERVAADREIGGARQRAPFSVAVAAEGVVTAAPTEAEGVRRTV